MVKVRQGNGCFLRGKCVVNTSFKVTDYFWVLDQFVMQAKVLDIGVKA